MDVGDQQAQQDHKLVLSSDLSSKRSIIPLPANFRETLETCIHAAGKLATSFPNIHDFEFLSQVVDALGEIVCAIDEAVGSLDLSDALLPQVSRLLFIQSQVLQFRYFLGIPDDFLRALHLLEVLPQLRDPTDAKFSQDISGALRNVLPVAATRFLNHRALPEFWVTRLIKGCDGPSDFMTLAQSIAKQVDSISHIPAEVGACNYQSPIIQDIDSVIATVNNVIEQCNPSNHDLEAIARLLSVQVMALQARFQLLGNIADLDRAMYVSEVAPQFHTFTSNQSSIVLKRLTSTSSDYLHDNSGLNTNITTGQGLLRHSYRETQIPISMHLADLLLSRSLEQDSTTDGEQALQLLQDILPFVTGETRPTLLRLHTGCIVHLSWLGKQFPDLHQCVEVFDQMLNFANSDLTFHERFLKASFLWNQLRNAAVTGNKEVAVTAFHELQARGYLHYELAEDMLSERSEFDLVNVIDTLTKVCVIHSQDVAFKPFAIVLVIALSQQHTLTRDTRYLQEALSLRSQLGPPGSYGLDLPLYKKAIVGHSSVEQISEVTKAIASSSKGIIGQYPEVLGWKDRPGQRDDPGVLLGRLSDSLMSITPKYYSGETLKEMRRSAYERNGDDSSFQISHRELLFQVQLSASKNDPDRRLKALHDLGGLYSKRYERQNDMKYLDHALDWYQQAVNVSGEDNQTWIAWSSKTKWADVLFDIHRVTNSVEHSLLLQAHDYYRQAAASTCNSLQPRLIFLLNWIIRLPILQTDGQEHILDVCELATSLLEEQSWAASSPRLSINTRYERKELIDMIVWLALKVGVDGNVAKAIGLMETSQGLVWGQLHRLRAPLGDLEPISPVLTSRFQHLSGLLESRMGLMNTNLESNLKEDGSGGLMTNNWQLNHDMNEVIEEIRTLPGFEKFLRRGSFGEDELREVAKHGPVVILLNVGGALILQQDCCKVIGLPITGNGLRKLHKHFRTMANSRDTHDAPDLAEGPTCADAYPSAGPSDSAGSSRAGVQVKRKALVVESLLDSLWKQVVGPVLNQILGGEGKWKDNPRMWEIPKLEDRQRIWWCCQGEFSFLPIHAAGIYSGNSPICLSDFFVSSYTPTLTALLDARARPTPPEVKVLAAVQPNPGGRWKSLAKVKDELKEIIELTPPANLISLGNTDQPDFEGHHTSVDNVLKRLPEASVLHLACHGTQHEKDPLNSGFVLADAKKLTIEELMKCRLPNAHTAILSACHTASNDAEQPYEAINLSSALLFLGFSNILGTKWPMNDNDGPVIAKAVYQALFNTTEKPDAIGVDPQEHTSTEATPHNEERQPTLASFSLFKVVDSVARELRSRKVPAKRWATFVHVGI